MKRMSRTTWFLLSGLVYTLIAFFFLCDGEVVLRRWLHVPKTMSVVQDPDSDILDKLIEYEQFSHAWTWDLILTFQRTEAPSAKNNYELEYARREWSGIYDQYDIRIEQKILRYSVEPDKLKVEDVSPTFPEKDIIDAYIPRLNTILSEYTTKCFYNSKIVQCKVIIYYSKMTEEFLVNFDAQVRKSKIDATLNELLGYIE